MLRSLITSSGSDDQAINFGVTNDTIVLESGGNIYIGDIRDSLTAHNLRINTNQTAIKDSSINLNARLLARINADSLTRYINDTTLDGQLRDTSAVLRNLITSSGSDDQAINFGVTNDTIVLESGGNIYIGDIRDSLTAHNLRINTNIKRPSKIQALT